MKDIDNVIIVRSHDFEKKLSFHVKKNWLHQTKIAERFRGTNSIQTNLKENDDVIIGRSCYFGKTLYFSFRKDYVDLTLAAELPKDTN